MEMSEPQEVKPERIITGLNIQESDDEDAAKGNWKFKKDNKKAAKCQMAEAGINLLIDHTTDWDSGGPDCTGQISTSDAGVVVPLGMADLDTSVIGDKYDCPHCLSSQ